MLILQDKAHSASLSMILCMRRMNPKHNRRIVYKLCFESLLLYLSMTILTRYHNLGCHILCCQRTHRYQCIGKHRQHMSLWCKRCCHRSLYQPGIGKSECKCIGFRCIRRKCMNYRHYNLCQPGTRRRSHKCMCLRRRNRLCMHCRRYNQYCLSMRMSAGKCMCLPHMHQ